jgi:hypothetical protein
LERILTEERGVVKKKYNLLWREGRGTTIYGGKRAQPVGRNAGGFLWLLSIGRL